MTSTGYAAAETLLRKRRTLGPFQNATVAKLRSQFPDYLVEDLPQSLHQPNLGNNDQLGNVLERSTGIFSTADCCSTRLPTPAVALPPNSEFGAIGDHAKIFMMHKQASLSQHSYNVEVLISPKYWDVRHPDGGVRKQRIDSVTNSTCATTP